MLVLKFQAVDGFSCTRRGDALTVTWSDFTTPFPSSPLQLYANDSTGALTARNVSVVLCECNDGNCTMDMSTLDTAEFDHNRYYQWPCECPEFFSGDSCEVDERGCGDFSVCPAYSVCVNDRNQANGYMCQDCSDGYEVSSDGMRCIGKF